MNQIKKIVIICLIMHIKINASQNTFITDYEPHRDEDTITSLFQKNSIVSDDSFIQDTLRETSEDVMSKVLRVENQTIGFVHYGLQPCSYGEAHIDFLVLDKKKSYENYKKIMLEYAIDDLLSNHDIETINIWTPAYDQATLDMYKHCGFSVTKTEDSWIKLTQSYGWLDKTQNQKALLFTSMSLILGSFLYQNK